MPYNNLISRSDADALIPEETAAEVIQLATAQSAALTLCRTVPMSSKLKKMPVLSALPVAYAVAKPASRNASGVGGYPFALLNSA